MYEVVSSNVNGTTDGWCLDVSRADRGVDGSSPAFWRVGRRGWIRNWGRLSGRVGLD